MVESRTRKAEKLKVYEVKYYSRYYRFDTRRCRIKGTSKSNIRSRWHEIMLTDEFIIKSMEEVK